MLTELCRPFSYLSIRHPRAGVRWINWWAPLIFTSILLAVACWLERPIDLFSGSGLLAKILGFIQSLPGFYLAALAAVATFNNPDMDKLMPGQPPVANILHNGVLTTVSLTRRRMLCIMFAYLTALSFGLTLATITSMTFADAVKAGVLATYPAAASFIKGGFAALYLMALIQMLTVTLWGLFYLGERIHTPDR